MPSNNDYMRKYMADRYRRRQEIAKAALGGKCSKCGSTEDLEFDHVIPQKKAGGFTITKRLAGVAESKLQEEIKKCQLLCWDCHNEKTQEELGRSSTKGRHGTLSTYRYCKCAECRAANTAYSRKWKEERKC
jgi:5-methylcytosine-specific restriction endonuclease McrA